MKIEEQQFSEISARLSEPLPGTKADTSEYQDKQIPSLDSIIEVVSLLKQILFPGFSDKPDETWHSSEAYIGKRLEKVAPMLAEQVCIAFKLKTCESTESDLSDPHSQRGTQLTQRFLEQLPELRRILNNDVQAAYDGDPACQDLNEVVLCYPGLQAVLVHRLAHELYNLDVPLLPRMLAEWVHGVTGIDIHPGAQIGEHFFIDHGTGVVIGQTCVIGQHVKIYQGVTLGALSFPTDGAGALVRNTKRHPTIEDNVVIYANATVLGGNTVVGHDSVIGSSVWLTRSVDPFTTVVMEKPELHIRNQAPSDFTPPLDYQI